MSGAVPLTSFFITSISTTDTNSQKREIDLELAEQLHIDSYDKVYVGLHTATVPFTITNISNRLFQNDCFIIKFKEIPANALGNLKPIIATTPPDVVVKFPEGHYDNVSSINKYMVAFWNWLLTDKVAPYRWNKSTVQGTNFDWSIFQDKHYPYHTDHEIPLVIEADGLKQRQLLKARTLILLNKAPSGHPENGFFQPSLGGFIESVCFTVTPEEQYNFYTRENSNEITDIWLRVYNRSMNQKDIEVKTDNFPFRTSTTFGQAFGFSPSVTPTIFGQRQRKSVGYDLTAIDNTVYTFDGQVPDWSNEEGIVNTSIVGGTANANEFSRILIGQYYPLFGEFYNYGINVILEGEMKESTYSNTVQNSNIIARIPYRATDGLGKLIYPVAGEQMLMCPVTLVRTVSKIKIRFESAITGQDVEFMGGNITLDIHFKAVA